VPIADDRRPAVPSIRAAWVAGLCRSSGGAVSALRKRHDRDLLCVMLGVVLATCFSVHDQGASLSQTFVVGLFGLIYAVIIYGVARGLDLGFARVLAWYARRAA
jgi:hypothetical protein